MFINFMQRIKAAFWRVVTCDHLAKSIHQHTEACNALSVSMRQHSASLLTKGATIDSLAEDVKYLAQSERRTNQRSGQPHEF
jgi:hypothetical protein